MTNPEPQKQTDETPKCDHCDKPATFRRSFKTGENDWRLDFCDEHFNSMGGSMDSSVLVLSATTRKEGDATCAPASTSNVPEQRPSSAEPSVQPALVSATGFDFTPWIPPFSYDPHGTRIVDSKDRLILDVRGWGFLTGKGCEALGIHEAKACSIQDALGGHVVALLNASSVGAGGSSTAPPGASTEWKQTAISLLREARQWKRCVTVDWAQDYEALTSSPSTAAGADQVSPTPDSNEDWTPDEKERVAIAELASIQGLSHKQVIRCALREYQLSVKGAPDIGDKAPPAASADLGQARQALGDWFATNHNLNLLGSELGDIIHAVGDVIKAEAAASAEHDPICICGYSRSEHDRFHSHTFIASSAVGASSPNLKALLQTAINGFGWKYGFGGDSPHQAALNQIINYAFDRKPLTALSSNKALGAKDV